MEDQRKINALVRVGRVMAATADYEQALAGLIETVSVLLNVETGGFLLYEPERDELVLQEPAFGLHDSRVIREYHVPLSGTGNAVQVFLTRQPYMTNDARADPRLITRFVDMFAARNVLSVPLVVEDSCIGVFHAINKRTAFSSGDLELLSLLAPLLAVSIRSARMFREMSEGRRQLERAMFLQNELSRTALDAPGMEPLAERLAELLDRPVMVADHAFQPLASARWPDGCEPGRDWLRVPEPGAAAAGASGRAGAAGAGADAAGADGGSAGRPRIAQIAVGRHFGGHLAVLEAGRPLDAIDMRAIEQAATIFALEMLREQSAYEAESRIKGNLLEDLFTGAWHGDAEASALLRRLGYTLDGACRVARLDAVIADGPAPGARAPGGRAPGGRWREQIQRPESRLYTALSQACEQIWGAAAVAPWRSGFLALLPADRDQAGRDAEVAAALLARVASASRTIAPALGIRFALGTPADGPAALARSLEEAERALMVARRLQLSDRPVFFEHLGVYRVLLGPNDASHQRGFAEEILGCLQRHDADTGSELVATLRCWIAADYSVAQAARRLYVHPNTVKYRLRRIRDLLGGDPSRGDLRLQIELALKILDLPQLGLDVSGSRPS
jgi:hypothetical protein